MKVAEAVTEEVNTVIVAATAVVIAAIIGKYGHKPGANNVAWNDVMRGLRP